MHAAVVHQLKQDPAYEEFADPIPESNEVLIRVRAAGLHPIVKAVARGEHYSSSGQVPMVVGLDGVGTRPDGKRVFFGGPRRPWGTMAELCAAPASMCVPLPENLDDIEAAAIANPGMSAWLSITERAALTSGETVLILGATGVAGHLAIQIAKQAGAKRVIAAGRNVESLAGNDVDAVIGLAEPEETVRAAFLAEAQKGIDVIIDYLWGRPTELALEALAKGFHPSATRSTRLVEIGESAGKTINLPGATLRSIDLKMMGSGFGSVPLANIRAAIPKLFEMAAAGTLQIETEPVPLREVESAWNRVEKGRRVVFTVN